MELRCRDAATMLARYSVLLELAGESPYRARAYAAAAEQLAALDQPLAEALSSGALASVPGIGKGILETLTELSQTGTIAELERLEREIPAGVIELTELRGVGPKRARQLWQELGITSIDQLEQACRQQQLRLHKGFTERTEATLLEAIDFWRASRGRTHRHKAWRLLGALAELLRSCGIEQLLPAGQLRRGCEVIDALTAVAVVEEPASMALPEEFVRISPLRYRWQPPESVPVELVLARPQEVGTALFLATGSDAFITAVVGAATLPPFATEEEVFAHLGMQPVPPQLREDASFIAAARAGSIPTLIDRSHMRGMLHVHTTWSDGKHTIEEMARAAQAMGFEYIAICDHSRSAAYAGGLSIEMVKQQRQAIAALNEQGLGITVLHGIESDILPDGSLDYPDEVLEQFDLVVGSVHSHFGLSYHEQTQRILRALRNSYLTILGHPTGRLLLRREGYAVDIDAIIAEAARTGTVIEFNVNPYRYDLDWRYHPRATAAGVRFAIDPDAHSTDGMAEVWDGITVAGKGALTPECVINTIPLAEFRQFVAALRDRKRALAS